MSPFFPPGTQSAVRKSPVTELSSERAETQPLPEPPEEKQAEKVPAALSGPKVPIKVFWQVKSHRRAEGSVLSLEIQ